MILEICAVRSELAMLSVKTQLKRRNVIFCKVVSFLSIRDFQPNTQQLTEKTSYAIFKISKGEDHDQALFIFLNVIRNFIAPIIKSNMKNFQEKKEQKNKKKILIILRPGKIK